MAAANVQAALEMTALYEERQREAERQARDLRLALDETEAASREKDKFLANVSHELRTPLNGIIGMVTLLADSARGELEQRYVRAALDSAEALLAIINDLLDLAKIRADGIELIHERYDLWRLLGSVVYLLAPRASEGVELGIDIDPALPRIVLGDGPRLRQVLLNLFGNALKFTDAGRVELLATAEELEDGRATLVLSVRDTGCGIPESAQGVVFESFRQVDGGANRRHGGTGLGLAISRGLVGQMGGTLALESEVGRGSLFTIRLPIDRVATPVSRSDHVRVACCVDSPELGATLERHLGALGIEVRIESDLGSVEELEGPLVIELAGQPSEHVLNATRFALDSGRLVAWIVRLGRGCEFTVPAGVHLLAAPLAPSELVDLFREVHPHGPQPARPGARSGDAGRSYHLLVVEDNPVNRLVAERLLQREGHRVSTAESGQAALDLLEHERFDAVLMDCQMPGIDGYETTRRLRARGERVPIIALTAHAMPADRQRCLDAGMDDYVTKPIDSAALAKALARQVAEAA